MGQSLSSQSLGSVLVWRGLLGGVTRGGRKSDGLCQENTQHTLGYNMTQAGMTTQRGRDPGQREDTELGTGQENREYSVGGRGQGNSD